MLTSARVGRALVMLVAGILLIDGPPGSPGGTLMAEAA